MFIRHCCIDKNTLHICGDVIYSACCNNGLNVKLNINKTHNDKTNYISIIIKDNVIVYNRKNVIIVDVAVDSLRCTLYEVCGVEFHYNNITEKRMSLSYKNIDQLAMAIDHMLIPC